MAVQSSPPHRSAPLEPAVPAALRRRALLLGLPLLAVLTVFSPAVSTLLSPQAGERVPLASAPLGTLTRAGVQDYAHFAPAFQRALDEVQPGERRRVVLSEQHFQLYRQATAVLGEAQTTALLSLLTREIRNQNPARGRRSVYASPEAAMDSAQGWIAYIAWATAGRRTPAQLDANAPAPLSSSVVLGQRTNILRAANAAHLLPGMLAAIVDNERSGQGRAYGLAGLLRDFTDTAALRTTQAYGDSGVTGDLSQTVGLTQMSWRDALLQRPRFHALGMELRRPFPRSELQAREALMDPADNLLLTASRLVGYLDEQEGAQARPHTSADALLYGPGWHNNPALLSGGQTWPYAWNGFFKGLLYTRLLER